MNIPQMRENQTHVPPDGRTHHHLRKLSDINREIITCASDQASRSVVIN